MSAEQVKPGYKRTEVGVIPEDWVAENLAKVADVKTGPFGSSLHERDYVQDGTPIITVEHLGDFGVEHINLPMISDVDRQRLQAYQLVEGDIVFSRVGSVDRNALIRKSEAGWLFSGRLLRVRPNNSKTHSPFLSFQFHSEPFKASIRSVAVGQTMASLNTQILNNMGVTLPPIAEQRAIAAALSDVDALLIKLDQLITKKRDLKQATMQQLLTGQTRLPGFSGEWEVKRMASLGTTYGGLAGKTKDDFGRGDSRYIPFMNVMTDTVIDPNWLEQVNVDPGEAQNIAKKGDLFFNGSSETPEEVGYCSVLLEDIPNLYLNSFCFGFRFNPESMVNGLFFAYWFRCEQGRKAMSVLAQGATRYNISKSAFLQLEIPQPSADEQAAIATVLSDMDAELAALEARRDKTRTLKQGMMQELLTGRIRLV